MRRIYPYHFIFVVLLVLCISCDENIEPIVDPPVIDVDVPEEFETTPNNNLDTEGAVVIVFHKDAVTVTNPYEGKGVAITRQGADVVVRSTTTDELTYILTGSTMDGSLKIYSDVRFELKMNGVSIVKPNDPALNIQSGKRAVITLVEGASNRIAGGKGFVSEGGNEDMKAAFFSEGQLVFSGTGSLTAISRYRHAICSDDYIRMDGGHILIPLSAQDGIHAKDYIEINDGLLEINSISDGMDSEGTVHLFGGTVQITTTGKKGHGVKSAAETIVRTTGDIKIDVQGEASKAFNCGGNMQIMQGNIRLTTSGSAFYDTEESDISSAAGIKCNGNLTISGGDVVITSSGAGGKGLNGNGLLTISNGTLSITTTGDEYKYRNDNTKAKAITMNGNLTISGGSVYVSCKTDHAIGTKGMLTASGGTAIGITPDATKKSFDAGKSFKITGGRLIGIGGTSGSPTTNDCTQYSVQYSGSITQNAFFHVVSSAGKGVVTYQLPYTSSKAFVLFSSPNLEKNTNYTISTGGAVTGGTSFHGLYDGASHTGGTPLTTFTVSSMVTDVK